MSTRKNTTTKQPRKGRMALKGISESSGPEARARDAGDGGRAKVTSRTARPTPHMEAELAVHIAAILAHPFTPAGLYNAITDEITALDSDVPAGESTDTPEYIERILNWHRGFGFRSLGHYTEERLPDGRIITHLKRGA